MTDMDGPRSQNPFTRVDPHVVYRATCELCQWSGPDRRDSTWGRADLDAHLVTDEHEDGYWKRVYAVREKIGVARNADSTTEEP